MSSIDRFNHFIDKFNCSSKRAIKDGLNLSGTYWGLQRDEVGDRPGGSYGKWKLQRGIVNVHPLSYLLIGRFTFTASQLIDLDKLFLFQSGVIAVGFYRGFRASPGYPTTNDEYTLTMYNVAMALWNKTFGYDHPYALSRGIKI